VGERWALQGPDFQRPENLGVDSLVLSLRTMFDPLRARGVELALELAFGEDRFEVLVADGRFTIERGAASRPEVCVRVQEPTALAYVVHGGAPLQLHLDGGQLRLEGRSRRLRAVRGGLPKARGTLTPRMLVERRIVVM
jgi:hypothetical protein